MYLTQYDLCHVLLRLANFCSIDISKAFDKVNHYALFVKLTKRLFPMQLLDIIVKLFSDCVSCVKWDRVYSSMFVIIRLEFIKVQFYHANDAHIKCTACDNYRKLPKIYRRLNYRKLTLTETLT